MKGCLVRCAGRSGQSKQPIVSHNLPSQGRSVSALSVWSFASSANLRQLYQRMNAIEECIKSPSLEQFAAAQVDSRENARRSY